MLIIVHTFLIAAFGKLHPLMVHFPIALLMVFAFWDLLQLKKPHSIWGFSLLSLGAISSIFSVLMGFALEDGGGFDFELIENHEHFGLYLTFVSLVFSGLYYWQWKRFGKKVLAIHLPFNLAILSLLAVTGHYGGALTRGEAYLTVRDFIPAEKLVFSEEQKPLEMKTAVIYRDLIQPMFTQRCVQCHQPANAKGGLIMSNYQDLLVTGGKDGAVIVPNNAEGSMIVQRVLLPEDHRLRMPTGGAKGFSKQEITLLKWWINTGASDTLKLINANPSAEVKAVLQALIPPQDQLGSLSELKLVPPAEQLIQQAKAAGWVLNPLTEKALFFEARWPSEIKASSHLWQAILPLKEHIVWLNLSSCNDTDGFQYLEKFNNLCQLNLAKSSVTDANLKGLKNMKHLQVLNLAQTQVTKAGISELKALSSLQKLYLWSTPVENEASEILAQDIIVQEPRLKHIPFDSSLLKPRKI